MPRPAVSFVEYHSPSYAEAHHKAIFAREKNEAIEPIHHRIGRLAIRDDIVESLHREVAGMETDYIVSCPFATVPDLLFRPSRETSLLPITASVLQAAVPHFYRSVEEHVSQLHELHPEGYRITLDVSAGPYKFWPENVPHVDDQRTNIVSYTTVLLGETTSFQSQPYTWDKVGDHGWMTDGQLVDPRQYEVGDVIVHHGTFTPHAAPDASFNGHPRIFMLAAAYPRDE